MSGKKSEILTQIIELLAPNFLNQYITQPGQNQIHSVFLTAFFHVFDEIEKKHQTGKECDEGAYQ